MANIGSLVVRIGADVGGLERGLQTAQSRLRGFGSQMKSIGGGLTLGLTAPIAGIATMALRSAAGFEQSMNLMQATTGATGAQMAALQQQALNLGATTSFSAGEAAEAMLELAKAGMTVEQTSAAIGGVMDLAAAGGIDLASAATITANAINSFGLEASAATDVANTFAAAANASSADVTDLAQGFQMAGAVFAANGQSVEDLAASLAILSNNGIAGSDAGTSLKTMMMRLSAPTKEAAGEINKLGLDIYDSTGAMLPFGDIIGQLESATAGLSDEQRNAALSTIFGADAIRAATILAGEGSVAYEAMMGAVSQEGAAAALADAQMKGLGGAFEYFKGTVDSVLIGAALPFTEMLGGWVRGAADALTAFTTLSPGVQQFGAVLLAVVAVGGPLLMLLGTMSTALAGLMSPVGLVVGAVGLLGVAWATNFGGIRDATAAAWAAIQPYLAQAWAWLQAMLPAALATLQGWFNTAWTAVSGAVSAAWAVMGPLLAQLGDWLLAQLPGALATLQGWFSTAWTAISTAVGSASSSIGPALETINGVLTGLWEGLQRVWSIVSGFLSPAIDRLGAAFGTVGPQIAGMGPVLDGMRTAVEQALTAAGAAFSGLWTVVQPVLQALGGAIALIIDFGINLLASAVENMAGVVGPVFEQLNLVISTVATIVQETVALITAIVTGDWATAWQSAQDIVAAFGAFVLGTFENLLSVVTTTVSAIWTAVVGTLTDMGVDMQAVMTGITAWWQGSWQSLVDFVQPAIDAVSNVVDALQGVWDWLQSHVFVNPFSGWDFNPFNNGDETTVPPTENGKNAESGGEFGNNSVRLPASGLIIGGEKVGGGVSGGVVIQQVVVRNDLDLEQLLWKLDELRRRRGR